MKCKKKKRIVKMNNSITLINYNIYLSLVKKIEKLSTETVHNFLEIGRCLKNVKENELYKCENYESVYEFGKDKFGYKETSIKNFINCFEKYASHPNDLEKECEICDDFKQYTITSLVELLPVSTEEIKQTYSSDMTIKKIREKKIVSQLTDELQAMINRYNEVIELLLKEVQSFNQKMGREIIKHRVISNKLKIDSYELYSVFEYGYHTFYIYSTVSYPLRVNYEDGEFCNEEILEKFNTFLENVTLRFKYDEEIKIQRKEEKQKEKEKSKLPYKEISLDVLKYSESFIYAMFLYLEYAILNGRNMYDLKCLKYKEQPIYEYPIIYEGMDLGVFSYNKQTKETCLKLKLPRHIESNNSLDCRHDLNYWTIDTKEKESDLFSSQTLRRIQRCYNLLKNEEQISQ